MLIISFSVERSCVHLLAKNILYSQKIGYPEKIGYSHATKTRKGLSAITFCFCHFFSRRRSSSWPSAPRPWSGCPWLPRYRSRLPLQFSDLFVEIQHIGLFDRQLHHQGLVRCQFFSAWDTSAWVTSRKVHLALDNSVVAKKCTVFAIFRRVSSSIWMHAMRQPFTFVF